MKPEYYEVVPVYPLKPGQLVNASLGFCMFCDTCVTGMGGGEFQICVECFDKKVKSKAWKKK